MSLSDVDKRLNRACDEESLIFSDPLKADDHRRKANLFFRAAMKDDGTPMAQGETVI